MIFANRIIVATAGANVLDFYRREHCIAFTTAVFVYVRPRSANVDRYFPVFSLTFRFYFWELYNLKKKNVFLTRAINPARLFLEIALEQRYCVRLISRFSERRRWLSGVAESFSFNSSFRFRAKNRTTNARFQIKKDTFARVDDSGREKQRWIFPLKSGGRPPCTRTIQFAIIFFSGRAQTRPFLIDRENCRSLSSAAGSRQCPKSISGLSRSNSPV